MPKVSVLLPLYNCEEYIGEAVESILNQTLGDFELLIINEAGSPAETIERYAAADDRIRIIQKTCDKGIPYSLNIGLELARGEYIARMDQDDISLPDRFETQTAFMDARPEVDICGSNVEFMAQSSVRLRERSNYALSDGEIKATLLFESTFAHPTVMFRASSVREHNIRYCADYMCEDYELWARMAPELTYANIERPLIRYRVHGGNYSANPKLFENAREISKRSRRALGIELTELEESYITSRTCELGPLRQLRLLRSVYGKYIAACEKTGYCPPEAMRAVLKRYVGMKPSAALERLLGRG